MLIDGLPLANRDTGHRDEAGNLHRLRIWHPVDGEASMLPRVAMVTIEGAAPVGETLQLWRSIVRIAAYDLNADSHLVEQYLPHEMRKETLYRIHTGVELGSLWERVSKESVIALIVPGGVRHAQ